MAGKALAPILLGMPALSELGPKMRALPTNRQRAFVWAYSSNGGNAARAAAEAGYSDKSAVGLRVVGYKLSHDERVLEAIHECASKMMHAAAVPAVAALINLINNPGHKDHGRAIGMVLDRTGFLAVTEHKVTVEHRDTATAAVTAEVLERIRALALKAGIDPDRMPALPAPKATDAEFEEVTEEHSAQGLEDVL